MNKPIDGVTAPIGLLLTVLLISPAAAGEDPAFETQTTGAIGSPVVLAFADTQLEPTTKPVILNFAQRFRLPRYTPFALELNFVNGYGVGANLLIDAYRNDNLRIHLFDVGYTRWFHRDETITVSRLPRTWDLTFGAGADFYLSGKSWFIVDYRFYLPDPMMLNDKYIGLSHTYVDEAMKGGMLCLGLASSW